MAPSTELNNLISQLQKTDGDSFPNEEERHQAIIELRRATRRLEKPWDTLLHMVWGIPATTIALKICIDLGIFNKLEDGPKHTSELAKAVGADEMILIRMMRHLAAEHVVTEEASDTYSKTPLTSEIANGVGYSAVDFVFDFGWQGCLTMPEYLQKTNYALPTSATNGNFQYAMKTERPCFGPDGYLVANPQMGKNFSDLMIGYTSQRQKWVEVFPTKKLLDGASKDEVLIVDMGGNAGEDLGYFIEKHPEAKNRVVLQDLKEIIDGAKVPDGIKAEAHDFFTPQPVKGARAYFFHSIFHDWPDHDCLRIMENLKPAMGADSVLLLSENVIPPTGAKEHQTALDVLMMAFLGSTERSEDMWSELLGKGGFKIKQVHPGRLESVIEAVPS